MELRSGKTHVADGAKQCSNRTVDGDLDFMAKALRTLSGLDKPPAVMVQPSRMHEIRHNTYFGFSVVIALYFGWCVYDRWAGPLPSQIKSGRILSELPVALGDKLRVRIELTRYRVCQRQFWWMIQDHAGNRRRFSEPPIEAIGHTGPDSFNQDFPIPTDLEPGPGAKLRIVWSWQCPENLIEAISPVTTVLKDIPFEIAPK